MNKEMDTKLTYFNRLTASPVVLIGFFATIAVTIWFLTQHIGFTSDSTTDWLLNEYLLGKQAPASFLFFRTPGYPLLMILGGVSFFHSFIGLLLIQAIMAILIPILIYKTLLLVVPKIAFGGAIISILTLLPVVYSKTIMTEHAFIFTMTLLTYLFTLYHQSKNIRHFYMLIFCLVFLTLIRPSANFVFMIIIPACLIISIKNYKQIVIGSIIFLLLTSIWPAWVRIQMTPVVNQQVSFYKRLQQDLFYHIYSKNTSIQNYFAATNGPASQKLNQDLSHYVFEQDTTWSTRQPEIFFAKYNGHPEDFVNAIYNNPNPLYLQYLNSAVLASGETNSNHLFYSVAKEAVSKHPSLLFSFIWNSTLGASTGFAGQQLFYHVYVSANALLRHGPLFSPANGPASQRLFDSLKSELPETLLQEKFIQKPDFQTFWDMWSVMDRTYTPLYSPPFFLNAAWESLKLYPKVLAVFVENFFTFYFGPSVTYNSSERVSMLTTAFSLHWWDDASLPKVYQEELKAGFRKYDTKLWSLTHLWPQWGIVWLFLKPLIFLLLAATFLLTIGSGYFSLIFVFVILLVYQGAVVSLFGEPLPRYVDQILLLAITTCFMSVPLAVRRMKLLSKSA